ncbi:hypothetical protein FKW77_006252 [Venturia effusa]|uniref:Zn(2)-C6 fungal-type domain-containing protein n=1 Tax=Venturia effusa TaxID=50376 RepID=A0A517LKD5_9PEZI|nr:hypothetical protein FKW77_006252 [Venturia effusa]
MNVSQLLADDKPSYESRRVQPSIETSNNQNQYAATWQNQQLSPVRPAVARNPLPPSPYSAGPPPKHVTFEYILPPAEAMQDGHQQRARLPMRVNIWPHDATDSIVTTVKNFYGLYEGGGVSFEDKDGCTLIARYENFTDRQTVHVRVTDESNNGTPRTSVSPKRPSLGPPFEMGSQHFNPMQGASRPVSRATHNRSVSPHNNSREARSVSVSTNPKSRSRPGFKGRAGSAHGSFADPHGVLAGDSDSDGGNGSVTSSRRGKVEGIVASAEISVENIVEGGRRKRARFDSSELPLFVPSQVPGPTSLSSVSPQRRIDNPNNASPYGSYSNQRTFSYNAHPLPSPQSHGNSDLSYMSNGGTYGTPNGGNYGSRGMRQRPSYPPAGVGGRILPTPDPTVGSVISDEDVALQLMRLGDASNFSSHGRISTSTLADDALSGRAEVSEASDDGSAMDEDELPRPGYVSDEYSGEEYEDNQDASFKGESDGIMPEHAEQMRASNGEPKANGSSSAKRMGSVSSRKSAKPSKPKSSKIKTEQSVAQPISPNSLPPQSRKTSTTSLQFGPDEEDLSTKPRCQRCRKSKKGCDRQRPCGRCRDAGIGIEGCVSEDEGNGRKGRYGRHMGVAVKKEDVPAATSGHSHSHSHPHNHSHNHAPASLQTSMGPPTMMGISNKKRKR